MLTVIHSDAVTPAKWHAELTGPRSIVQTERHGTLPSHPRLSGQSATNAKPVICALVKKTSAGDQSSINTVALARCQNDFRACELFLQFLHGSEKPLKRPESRIGTS